MAGKFSNDRNNGPIRWYNARGRISEYALQKLARIKHLKLKPYYMVIIMII